MSIYDDVNAYLKEQQEQISPLERAHNRLLEDRRQRNLAEMKFATRAFARGIDQTQAMLSAGVGALGAATGIDPLKRWGLEEYAEQMEEASLYPGMSLRDIGGIFLL